MQSDSSAVRQAYETVTRISVVTAVQRPEDRRRIQVGSEGVLEDEQDVVFRVGGAKRLVGVTGRLQADDQNQIEGGASQRHHSFHNP